MVRQPCDAAHLTNPAYIADVIIPASYADVITSDMDRVCRTQSFITDELVFSCQITQQSSDNQITLRGIPCICDTACGLGYLLVPKTARNPFVSFPTRATILLADGSPDSITQSVDVVLTVDKISKPCQLLVLHTSDSKQQISVLFGRSLMSMFKISTISAERVLMGKTVLYDARRDSVRRILDLVTGEDVFDEEDCLKDGIVPLDPPPAHREESELVRFEVTHAQQEIVDRALSDLAAASAKLLPCCPGSLRLRSIDHSRMISDTSDQCYYFALGLDSVRVGSTHPRLYARGMFSRMSSDDQSSYTDQIQKYVDAGWWTPSPAADARAFGPPANVFAVKQKNKLRLVIDHRERNKLFPSTTSNPLISFSIALMRTLGRGTIHILDAASAFYRVRLDTPQWVHAAPGDFLCNRLSFGLSYGPEALDNSFGLLWSLFKSIGPNGTGARYVDDLWLHTPLPNTDDEDSQDTVDKADTGIPILVYMSSKCGYAFERKKFQIAKTGGPPVNILGLKFSYEYVNDVSCSVIRCCRESLCQFDINVLLTRPTKALVFEICGALAYDAARQHIDAKLVSDLLRSITGRYGGNCKQSWREVLDLDSFSAIDKRLYLGLVDWMREIIHTASPCHHSIPLALSGDTLQLRAFTDASHSGGGFVLQFCPVPGQWFTIWQDAWLWKRKEYNYHANRLEANCLFRALRTVAKFVDFVKDSRTGELKVPVSVSVFCDSTTAVSWASKPANSSGFESRAIDIASAGLRAEAYYLRSVCNGFSLNHVAGNDNEAADRLSRIFDRTCDTESFHSLLRKRHQLLRGKLAEMEDADLTSLHTDLPSDAVRRVQEPVKECLAEDISGSAYDIFSAIQRFGQMRLILRSWRAQREQAAHPELATGRILETTEILSHPFSTLDLELFVLSAQKACDMEKFMSNPFQVRPSGLIEHVRNDFTGELLMEPVIPAAARNTSRLVARTFHRLCAHRGSSFTGAAIKGFYLECRQAVVQSVVRSCMRCAYKNAKAKVQWSLPTSVAERKIDLPAFSRCCLDHLHLSHVDPRVLVLSCMCVDTGAVAFVRAEATTAKNAGECLRQVCNRYCVRLKEIRCDRASCFTSPLFLNYLRSVGQDPKITFTVPDAPYTLPVERLHREAWSLIRSSACIRRMILSNGDAQTALDEIACLINSRPVGYYKDGQDEYVLTPGILAFGGSSTSPRMRLMREFFYKQCFAQLRRVYQNSTLNQRRGRLIVGQRALLFREQCTRLEFPFDLVRIVDIRGSYFVVRVISTGSDKVVGSNQLAPIALDLREDDHLSSPFDVDRTGAAVICSYEGVDYSGTVVGDYGNEVEIRWDPVGDKQWHNELVSWGACRIAQSAV